ncbi:rhombosortase [bacterium]|nr:rhombosortase [bacterium]
MIRFAPFTTAIVIAAIVLATFPSANDWLIYDRRAIIQGEWWRLYTGHLVHISINHLLSDCCGFLIAGWILERQNKSSRAFVFVFAPLAISFSSILLAPEMIRYAGLSAWLLVPVVIVAIDLTSGNEKEKTFGWACLVILATKLSIEILTQTSAIVPLNSNGEQIATAAHLSGVACGLGIALYNRRVRNLIDSPKSKRPESKTLSGHETLSQRRFT